MSSETMTTIFGSFFCARALKVARLSIPSSRATAISTTTHFIIQPRGCSFQRDWFACRSRRKRLQSFFIQTQKSDGVVVEDIPFLFLGQKLCRFDPFDRRSDRLGPYHLIRAEHDPLPKT